MNLDSPEEGRVASGTGATSAQGWGQYVLSRPRTTPSISTSAAGTSIGRSAWFAGSSTTFAPRRWNFFNVVSLPRMRATTVSPLRASWRRSTTT